MTRTLRGRFWVEAGVATVSALLLVVTLVHSDWIETVFRVDPDQGSGALEWTIVAVAAAMTLVTLAAAWREWRLAPSPA